MEHGANFLASSSYAHHVPFGTTSDGRTTMCTWPVEPSGSYEHSLYPSTSSKLTSSKLTGSNKLIHGCDITSTSTYINLSLTPNVNEEQNPEALSSTEPPPRHFGHTRNARLGPE
jgi:hypothetical protein